MYIENTQGIEVIVEPEYLAEESNPARAQFVFAYHITITNKGELEVQLMNRHWIITDGTGTQREVKGAGVVGQQPRLKPGESHRYSSYCPLTTPTGNMRGSFEMINENGVTFEARIPLFFLRNLSALH